MTVTRDQILPQVFSRLAKNAWNYTRKRVTYEGMTNGLYDILGVLNPDKELSQDAIAKELGIDKSQCGKLIARGEELGYLLRKKGTDRRVQLVSLSEKGKKAIEQLIAAVAQWQDELFSDMTAEEKDSFFSELQSITSRSEQIN